MDLIKSIYHEKQEAGSMLCAQHALNNLLQNALFTPQDLAHMALELDQLEDDQLDEEEKMKKAWGGGKSENYDDSGFFSVMVMEEALKVLGLRLVRWKSQDMKSVHSTPEKMEAFILNHQLHWFTIRRFAVSERFYNLDSCKPAPGWISPTYLSLTLNECENQGYSIFVVVPTVDSKVTGLPPCDAADLAATLPTPSSRFGTSSASTSTLPSTSAFSGKGNTLGSSGSVKPINGSPSSSTSISTSTSNGNKRKNSPDEGIDGESESSVEGESEKRRKRRVNFLEPDSSKDVVIIDDDDDDDDEEEMIRRAVEESLKTTSATSRDIKPKPKPSSSSSSSKSPIILPKPSIRVEGSSKKGKEKKKTSDEEEEEDEELQRALKASLEGLVVSDPEEIGGKGKEKEKVEEDDNPSLEEMRRRRLARFG